MGPQVAVQRVFQHLDNWWGELDAAALSSIASAPERHLRAFIEQWPNTNWIVNVDDREDLLVGNQLRPVFGSDRDPFAQRTLGETLLLYTDEIAISSYQLSPTATDWDTRMRPRLRGSYDPGDPNSMYPPIDRERLVANLRWLTAIRPLAIDGSIKFVPTGSWSGPIYPYGKILKAIDPTALGISPDDIANSESDLSARMRVHEARSELEAWADDVIYPVWRGYGHPLALGNREDLMLREILSHKEIVGAGYSRGRALSNLVELSVPDVRASIADIIAIRNDSEGLAGWRAAASRAAASIDRASRNGDEPSAEDRRSFRDELEGELSKLLTESKRSPVLRTLTQGWRGFVLAGLGAGIPAAVGSSSPLLTATAAGAGAIAGALSDDALGRALEDRRLKRLNRTYLSFLKSGEPGPS